MEAIGKSAEILPQRVTVAFGPGYYYGSVRVGAVVALGLDDEPSRVRKSLMRRRELSHRVREDFGRVLGRHHGRLATGGRVDVDDISGPDLLSEPPSTLAQTRVLHHIPAERPGMSKRLRMIGNAMCVLGAAVPLSIVIWVLG